MIQGIKRRLKNFDLLARAPNDVDTVLGDTEQ